MSRRTLAPALARWMSNEIMSEEAKPEAVRELRLVLGVVRAAQRFEDEWERVASLDLVDPERAHAITRALGRLDSATGRARERKGGR